MSKRVALVALLAIMFLSSAAVADTLVNYATQGVFSSVSSGWTISADGNSISQTLGDGNTLTLAFTGIGNFPTQSSTGSSSTWIDLVDHSDGAPLWATAQLGSFNISSGPNPPSLADFTGLSATFTIDVYQFEPPSGDVSNASTVSFNGSIGYFQGGPSVIFGEPSFTWVNGTTYTETQPPLAGINWAVQSNTPLNAGSSGNTTLNGLAYVPEPASIMFFGTGLVGLAGVLRRRLGK